MKTEFRGSKKEVEADNEVDLRCRLVGSSLRQWRTAANLTQRQVADHFNYSNLQFISNWERGMSLPPLDLLPDIARLYNISPTELIDVFHEYQFQVMKRNMQKISSLFGEDKF